MTVRRSYPQHVRVRHAHVMSRRAAVAKYAVWGLFFVCLGGAAFQIAGSIAGLGRPPAPGADGGHLVEAGVVFSL